MKSLDDSAKGEGIASPEGIWPACYSWTKRHGTTLNKYQVPSQAFGTQNFCSQQKAQPLQEAKAKEELRALMDAAARVHWRVINGSMPWNTLPKSDRCVQRI